MSGDQEGYRIMRERCAICNRALKDPESVQFGLGPTCREEYFKVLGEKSPTMAQKRKAVDLVWEIREAEYLEDATEKALELKALGFDAAFWRLVEYFQGGLIEIAGVENSDKWVKVKAPYKPETLKAWRRIPSRFFAPSDKTNRVLAQDLSAAREILDCYYQGWIVYDHRTQEAYQLGGGLKR